METNDNKKVYAERVKQYDQMILQLTKHEQTVLSLMQNDPSGANYKRLVLADEMIFFTTLYLAKHKLSTSLLSAKNETILNEARKTLYKALIYLEDILTNYIDVPFSDYEANVKEIEKISLKQKYYLIRKLGFAISFVTAAYGDNTKWKWSFVEINGRYAAIAKNILDLKAAAASIIEPNSPDHDNTILHLRLVKSLLTKSADEYRKKYEVATNNIEDFRMAIQFLAALRRVHVLMNEHREAEEVKRKLGIWNDRMEKDRKGKK